MRVLCRGVSSSRAISPLAATLGRNLRRARDAAGLTQNELAVGLGRGVTFMRISEWERGINKPETEDMAA
jgi:transcriptional regulator with XRE-family HTH domain